MSWRAARSLAMTACLLAGVRCGSSTPATGAPATTPAPPAATAVADAAEEVAAFLAARLALSPEQQEKARRSAQALIDRNAKLADETLTHKSRILERLSQSQTRFDTEILSMLTSDQTVKYLQLKQSLHATVQGRPPFRGLSPARPGNLGSAPPGVSTTPPVTVTPS